MMTRKLRDDRVDRVPDDLRAERRADGVDLVAVLVDPHVEPVEAGLHLDQGRRLQGPGLDLVPAHALPVDLLGGGLDLGVAVAEALHGGAHRVLAGLRPPVAQRHARPALEVQAQVETLDADPDRADGQRHERDGQPQPPVAHEVELPADLPLVQAHPPLVAEELGVGEQAEDGPGGEHRGEQREQDADDSVNAKPLTPAVANRNRIAAVANVTTLASMIALMPFL